MHRSGSHGPEEPIGGSGGRGVLLLAVAVVLGIVILQATDDTGGGSADVTSGTQVDETTTTTTGGSPSGTTRPLRPLAEITVLPANGTPLGGLASKVNETLKANGYLNTLSAVDATRKDFDTTVVQYTTDYGPEAQVLAAVLGLPATVVKPIENPPVPDTRGANVVVIAGKDLERLLSSSAASTTTASG